MKRELDPIARMVHEGAQRGNISPSLYAQQMTIRHQKKEDYGDYNYDRIPSGDRFLHPAVLSNTHTPKINRKPKGQAVCPICDTAFTRFDIRQKYCSVTCRLKYNSGVKTEKERAVRQPIEKVCETCGKTYHAKSKNGRWCSAECRKAYEKAHNPSTRQLHMVTCVACGKDFMQTRYTQKFCSERCRGLQNNADYRERQRAIMERAPVGHNISKCAWCGQDYPKTEGGQRFCSIACRQESDRARRREYKKSKKRFIPATDEVMEVESKGVWKL